MIVRFPGLTGSPEDHRFRSAFIHWLLHSPIRHIGQQKSESDSIPRTIIQYWHDLGNLPNDVRECMDSWKTLRDHGFDHVVFDDESAKKFISEHYTINHEKAFDRCYHPAMRCDYFRLCYINLHGGFYVDADEVYQGTPLDHLYADRHLKIQPLCFDIDSNAMVSPKVFLKDVGYSLRRIYYVNNNPIVAPPNHNLVVKALLRATRILLDDDPKKPIQETTGPGNLSACLVRHAIEMISMDNEFDFDLLRDWERLSVCRWELEYRNDSRNWRLIGEL